MSPCSGIVLVLKAPCPTASAKCGPSGRRHWQWKTVDVPRRPSARGPTNHRRGRDVDDLSHNLISAPALGAGASRAKAIEMSTHMAFSDSDMDVCGDLSMSFKRTHRAVQRPAVGARTGMRPSGVHPGTRTWPR